MLRACTWLMLALIAVGCAPPVKVKVVLRLRPDQEELYRNRLLKPFEKKHNCIVEIKSYSPRSLLSSLPQRIPST
jgi:hypothetical protein